jgi:hypothetical protein
MVICRVESSPWSSSRPRLKAVKVYRWVDNWLSSLQTEALLIRSRGFVGSSWVMIPIGRKCSFKTVRCYAISAKSQISTPDIDARYRRRQSGKLLATGKPQSNMKHKQTSALSFCYLSVYILPLLKCCVDYLLNLACWYLLLPKQSISSSTVPCGRHRTKGLWSILRLWNKTCFSSRLLLCGYVTVEWCKEVPLIMWACRAMLKSQWHQ